MSAKVRLPHGSIPTGAIKDPAVREAMVKVNENVAKLLASVSELKDTVDRLTQGE